MSSKVFQPFQVTYVCDPCKNAGFAGDVCVHNISNKPDWITDQSIDAVQELMGNDRSILEREIFGRRTGDKPECFDEVQVDRMIATKRIDLATRPHQIFIVIDPCSGSDSEDTRKSDYCIWAITPPHILLACEAFDSFKPETWERKLFELLTWIRNHPDLSRATLVFDVETFTGIGAADVQRFVVQNGFDNLIFLTNNKRLPGKKLTNEMKMSMMKLTQQFFEEDRIRIWSQFYTTYQGGWEAFKKEFTEQCKRYAKFVTMPKIPGSGVRIHLSGKIKSRSLRDDICVTLQRAFLTEKGFYDDPQYRHFRIAV